MKKPLKPKLTDLIEKYRLNDDTFLLIKNDIVDDLTKLVESVENPKAIILGAQPGAGKSILESEAYNNLDRNALICNVDDLKDRHPYSQEIKREYPNYFTAITNDYAHKWNLALRNHCLENKYNFILETTINNGNNINIIIDKMKAYDYSVEIYLLSVPKIISMMGIFSRYEDSLNRLGESRKVSWEDHNLRFDAIPEAIKIIEEKNLYDYINLYSRDIMDDLSNKKDGVQLITRSRRSILNEYLFEREKPLSKKASEYIDEKEKYIKSSMIERKSIEDLANFNNALSNSSGNDDVILKNRR